jgi:hypothetical protein
MDSEKNNITTSPLKTEDEIRRGYDKGKGKVTPKQADVAFRGPGG